MPADFVIKAGDSSPVLTDTLTYSNGKPANLEGATLSFVMRTQTASSPQKLTGTTQIVEAVNAAVSYTFTPTDTANPGSYLANWIVTFASGKQMTWPTVGYLWIEIEPSLTSPGSTTLVGLPEVLDRLQVPPNDRVHDAKLTEWIQALSPLIENLTGPIIPKVYDEWYKGGHTTISLRHRPHTGLGTSPILNVLAVSEYRGPIEYDLLNVPTPSAGSVYSIMVNKQLGYIARRTSGGGSEPFWHDPEHGDQQVHVIYQAGQETVPANVKMAAIETLRWWWSTTQSVGRGSQVLADGEAIRPMVALPYHAEAMLAPTRKGPSIF